MKHFILFIMLIPMISMGQSYAVVDPDIYITATFSVANSCNNFLLPGTVVTLTGEQAPFTVYSGTTDSDGNVVFDSVVEGLYTIDAFKATFNEEIVAGTLIDSNYSQQIFLSRKAYPVCNLSVDPKSSIVTWDKPYISALHKTGFEGDGFPPDDWEVITDGEGWYRSSTADSMFNNWTIPDWPGHYAVTNRDYSTQGGSYDYLVTKNIDLRHAQDFKLYLDRYFDAEYGGTATVEYTTDDGQTWTLLKQLDPDTVWRNDTVDLSSLSGDNGLKNVKIGFHYVAGSGPQFDGWAVDNVKVHAGYAMVDYYRLNLTNGISVDSISSDITSWFLEDLVYGESYSLSLQSIVECDSSTPAYFTWESTYLYPPRGVSDGYFYNTQEVPVYWFPPVNCAQSTSVSHANPYIISEKPRTYKHTGVDESPLITIIGFKQTQSNKNTWDLQYSWHTHHNDGEAGVESDGNYLYITKWSGNRFSKYSIDGTLIEDFTIPGVSNIRDMAYDGSYFYGAAANTTLYKMDFINHALISTINAPVNVRGIAYNEDNNTFYAADWASDIVEFDMNGNIVSSFANGGLSGIYGLAYDKWSDGGPFLWIYDQGANNIIQVHLPEGTFTGVTVDVALIAGTAGPAAGLFTQPDMFKGTVTIGGVSQNDKAWGIELTLSPNCEIPEGLISYNIYRNDMLLGNVQYNNESKFYQYTYLDGPLPPGTYCYQLSALYDLTSYGFPNETDESVLTDCHNVTVVWGFDIPFVENWDNGSFEYNEWTTDGTGWVINNNTGNDAPSAQFDASGISGSYNDISLTSSFIKADSIGTGDIWLDFNLKLDDIAASGTEHLTVEVYDGSEWHFVKQFDNNGSFGFDEGFEHIIIDGWSKRKVFRIRFRASGTQPSDFNSWYVDNINIYHTCKAPVDIYGEYFWNGDSDYGAAISWEAPEMPYGPVWLGHCGEYDSGIGLTEGGDLTVAARWDKNQVAAFCGNFVKNIKYYIQDNGFENIVLKIWQGDDAEQLIFSEDVTTSTTVGEWNDFQLAIPVEIDKTKELWVGYTIYNQLAGKTPAGVDEGPAVTGYGDKISLDNGVNWLNISEQGVDANFLILMRIVNNTTGNYNKLTEFVLYRSENPEGQFTPVTTIPYVEGVTNYSYFDKFPSVEPMITYWYKVTAQWESELDQCESDYAMSKLNPDDDFVAVLVTDIKNKKRALLKLYPNPAGNTVTFNASEIIEKIVIINCSGKAIFSKEVNRTKFILNTEHFNAGVYIAKIAVNGINTIKRFVIVK